MIVSTALYLNLENTLISRALFPALMSDGKESYFNAIESMDSRIHLVAPAKDWLMLKIANPKIIELMNRKGVCILPTLFSHMLPDLFRNTLENQFALSRHILESLFGNIVWHGIIPENAMSSLIVEEAKKYWEGALLSVGHNNLRGLHVGDYELKGGDDCNLPLRVIANGRARLRYMQRYREEIGVLDVLESMQGENVTSSCLFDFERPWSNIVYYPYAGRSFARLDIWTKFHHGLSSEQILPFCFDSASEKLPLYLSDADLSLWENKESHWLIDIQKEVVSHCQGRGDYFEFASLVASSCMPPRVLTRFMQNDIFPSTYGGKSGVVDLVGDVSKVKELLIICKNIQQKRRVDYGAEFLSEGERLYLELLHKTLVSID